MYVVRDLNVDSLKNTYNVIAQKTAKFENRDKMGHGGLCLQS